MRCILTERSYHKLYLLTVPMSLELSTNCSDALIKSAEIDDSFSDSTIAAVRNQDSK